MPNYAFNLKHGKLLDTIESNERYMNNLYRNKVLLTGDASVVEKYYKEDFTLFETQYAQSAHVGTFWHNVGKKNARVMFGLIKMINDAFVRLVTAGGIEVSVLNNGEETTKDTERLNNILEENSFKDKLLGLAESYASGLGFAPFKVNYDTDIKNVPLIEVVDPFKTEAITERGFIKGFKFKKREKYHDMEFEVQEIWYMNDGEPILEYKVFDTKAQNPIEKDIFKLDKDIVSALGLEFVIENGESVFRDYTKLKDLPVVLKNNTPYNSAFPKSPFGEADTEQLDNIEDSLSELLSAMVEEVRKGRIKVMISDDLISKDENGHAKEFDDFKLDYEIVKANQAEGSTGIEVVQGEINTEKYLSGIAQLIMYGCNKANIHPVTVGITGVESIVSSQESQVEREKVSLRTREMKVRSWRMVLQELFERVLQVDDIMNKRSVGEYDIQVEFGEFTNPSPESVVGLLGKSIETGVMSMKKAQKQYFGDNIQEEELEKMYLQTLVEKGMPLTETQRTRYELLTGEEPE